MGRLCERPGCSEVAAVAYGMRPEDLVFWLDAIGEGSRMDQGVLCQRHGDSMVVPRGWTLDDLRDPHLHLFRPPNRPAPAPSQRRRRKAASDDADVEQLALNGLVDTRSGEVPDRPTVADIATTEMDVTVVGVPPAPAPTPASTPASEPVAAAQPDAAVDVDSGDADVEAGDAAPVAAWKPSFDDADDLDGLLSASSPLLSRAFRVNDRPD